MQAAAKYLLDHVIAQFHLNGGMRATSGGGHRLAPAVIECTLVH